MCNDDVKLYMCLSCEEETNNMEECPACGSSLITLNNIILDDSEELNF